MDKPYGRSYWVQEGELLAGFLPADRNSEVMEKKLTALLDCGILTYINLMAPDECDYYGEPFENYFPVLQEIASRSDIAVSCINIPIEDMDITDRQTMRRILDTIDASISQGKPVYVHCWGGLGRTGMVIGCWLKEQGMADNTTVFNVLFELRRSDDKWLDPSPQTREQCQFVLDW